MERVGREWRSFCEDEGFCRRCRVQRLLLSRLALQATQPESWSRARHWILRFRSQVEVPWIFGTTHKIGYTLITRRSAVALGTRCHPVISVKDLWEDDLGLSEFFLLLILSRRYGLIVNSNPASTPRFCRVKRYLALPTAPWASYVRQNFLPHRNFCMRAAFPAIPSFAFLASKGQRGIAFVMIAGNLPMGHLAQTHIAQYDRMLKEEILYQWWSVVLLSVNMELIEGRLVRLRKQIKIGPLSQTVGKNPMVCTVSCTIRFRYRVHPDQNI